EDAGDRGERTGTIGQVEVDVELRREVVDRADDDVVERGGRWPATVAEAPGRVDDVAQHGRRSGVTAGTPTEEHEVAHRGPLDEHRVVGVAHRGEGMVGRHHRRVDAHGDLDGAVDLELLGDGEQLHDVA